MRMPDCKECEELKTFNNFFEKIHPQINASGIKILLNEFRNEVKKWIVHFDSKPNLMNLGSCRILMDLFNFKEEELDNAEKPI